uniref:(northern house mosquito) hypothetical protein n=1 Tax=Culex pipiens TaxID=7175 RepID=A0A8D8JRH1_CULPI
MVVSCFIFHIALLVGIFQKNVVLVIMHGWFVFVASVFYSVHLIIDAAEKMTIENLNNFEITRIMLCLAVVCICFGFLNWLAIWVICGVKRYNRLEKSRKSAEHGNAASTSNLDCCCKYTSYLCLCNCFSCFYKDAVKHENNSPAGGQVPEANESAIAIANTSCNTKPENVPQSGLTEPTPGTSVQKIDHVITSASFNKSENEECVNLLMDKQSTIKKSRC